MLVCAHCHFFCHWVSLWSLCLTSSQVFIMRDKACCPPAPSQTFSRLSILALSSSLWMSDAPVIIFMVFCWTCSCMSISVWESRPEPSTPAVACQCWVMLAGNTPPAALDAFTILNSELAGLWSSGGLQEALSPFPLRCFLVIQLPAVPVHRVVPPQGQDLHFPLLNFMWFLSAHCSSLSKSLWMSAQPSDLSATPPGLVSSPLLREQHSSLSSRLLVRMLNSTSPRISPWDPKLAWMTDFFCGLEAVLAYSQAVSNYKIGSSAIGVCFQKFRSREYPCSLCLLLNILNNFQSEEYPAVC